MCFIREQIRDTDHYDWKVFPTSFQVQTSLWSSCVLRNVNLFRFCLPSDCILFSALQMTFFFCFFLSYIRLRDILFCFPSGCQFVGEIVLWWEGNSVVLLVFELLCTVHLESIVQHLFHSEGRHIINVETYLVAAKHFLFKLYLRTVILT